MPFLFSVKEAILYLLFFVLVPAPISALTVCSAFGLLLVWVTRAYLRWLLLLLSASLLLYVEDLLTLSLLHLRLALTSVTFLGVSTAALELFVLVLFFYSSTEVIVRSVVLLEFSIEVFDGPWFFSC